MENDEFNLKVSLGNRGEKIRIEITISILILIYIKLLNSIDKHKNRSQEKLSIKKDSV